MKNFDKEDLRKRLTPEQFEVTQNKATEKPFSGEYDKTNAEGVYHCIVCGFELFKSETKYDPGCGWPSFWAPSNEKAIQENVDDAYGMIRTEVVCSNCGAHLGHVFPDGPKETTGLRYCINSASLNLKANE